MATVWGPGPAMVRSLLIASTFLDPFMPTLQTQPSSPAVSVRSVLFGDLSKYRARRTPLMVYRLVQKYAEYGLVAFFCQLRVDGCLIDGSAPGQGFAVKCLTNTY
jgi:predicted phage gp36 major capsid-like protein